MLYRYFTFLITCHKLKSLIVQLAEKKPISYKQLRIES